jgi:hypothetical protein
MAKKKGKGLALALYFLLVVIMLVIMGLHVFGVYPLQTDFFARYMIALVFALLLLPLVPRIKIFDMVDLKRETNVFRSMKVTKKKK